MVPHHSPSLKELMCNGNWMKRAKAVPGGYQGAHREAFKSPPGHTSYLADVPDVKRSLRKLSSWAGPASLLLPRGRTNFSAQVFDRQAIALAHTLHSDGDTNHTFCPPLSELTTDSNPGAAPLHGRYTAPPNFCLLSYYEPMPSQSRSYKKCHHEWG